MKIDNSLLRELPDPFNFYCFLTSVGHLHFGYWPDDSPDLTLSEAQEKMFEQLLSHFPKPPAQVLDVGCGLGASAYVLAQKGYIVTGIAPSKAIIACATELFADERTNFQVAGYLDDISMEFCSQQYDVILFQESLQYFPSLTEVFQRTQDLLKPGGTVIIGDEIRYDEAIGSQTAVHSHKEVIIALLEKGFRPTRHQEIGCKVKKTCDYVIDEFSRNFDFIISEMDQANVAVRLQHFLDGWKVQKTWYDTGRLGYELFVARKDSVFFRAYQEGDEDKILPMFNRIFCQQRTLDHWRWKYRDNPFGSYKIVVAVDDEGTLAGHYAAYPVPYHSPEIMPVAGLVFHIGDTMTNPGFRHLGRGKTSVLARLVSFFYLKFSIGHIPFNYGYNTATIRKLGERYLGYEYTSPVSCYVLSFQETYSVGKNVVRKFFSGVSIERVTGVDADYDRFFDRVKNDYHSLVKRTSSYLKWRYLDCPDITYHFFSARRFGNLIGWGVFMQKGSILVWGDALFDRCFATVAASLLIDQAQQTFRGNIARIEAWFSPSPSWWLDILLDMGFVAEAEPNQLAPAYTIFDRSFSVDFFEKNHYYTMGDSDLF